jgi:hypothetical protein
MPETVPWALVLTAALFIVACRPIGRATHRFQAFMEKRFGIGLPLTPNLYSLLFAAIGLLAIAFVLMR